MRLRDMKPILFLLMAANLETQAIFHLEKVIHHGWTTNENLLESFLVQDPCLCRGVCMFDGKCSAATAVPTNNKTYSCSLYNKRPPSKSMTAITNAITAVKRFDGYTFLNGRYCGVQSDETWSITKNGTRCPSRKGNVATLRGERDAYLLIRLMRERNVRVAWVGLRGFPDYTLTSWTDSEIRSHLKYVDIKSDDLSLLDGIFCYALNIYDYTKPTLVPTDCSNKLPTLCCAYA
ncbi:uncharacterized protein LOC143019474 [Oratosquilla oratoria]|uniref:uncharacterized protein LOC143019474 n=1 Tax=Oratosquilla oratoria TaxID=337810 RepID=UPI003F7756C0